MPLINIFSGGISNDPRDTSQGVCRVCTNFDINTSPRRLIPYRSSESGDSAAATSKKQNFCIAYWGGTPSWRLFSLGVVSGTARAEVLMKTLGTSGTQDLGDSDWTNSAPANNSSSAGSTDFNVFVFYKKTGYIYGIQGPRYVWRFDPGSSGAWVDTHFDLGAGIVNTAQGLVHSQDDILYIPYDNKIASYDGVNPWVAAALTIPAQYYITSICEKGAYIAVAAAPLSQVGNSRVFIWDRSSTLATVTENIDWGDGVIKIIHEVGGYLVGISSPSSGTAITSTFKNKITFRYYTGAGAEDLYELQDTGTGAQTTLLPIMKQKIGGRLYFMMSISLNGSRRDGVWSFGRNAQGKFTLVHERTPNNDTAIDTAGLKAFFYVGDFLFQSYVTSSAFALSKTDDGVTYSATSIYESIINPNMPEQDKTLNKQLKSIAITYTTVSAVSGQCVVKYRVQGGTFTTALTCTTTGANTIEQIIDSSTGLPFTSGRELEFRLESTLGCEIISLAYSYEILPTLYP